MENNTPIMVGSVLWMYKTSYNKTDADLCDILGISHDKLNVLKAQELPTPDRAGRTELWIAPHRFHLAVDAIAASAGIVGYPYLANLTNILLYYCQRRLDDYRAMVLHWLTQLESARNAEGTPISILADVAIGITEEMRLFLGK